MITSVNVDAIMNPILDMFGNEKRVDLGSSDKVFFWKAHDKNGFLSQWHDSLIKHDDITFQTAEQCMMYMKAIVFGDYDMAHEIAATPHLHPNEHRKMGRLVANFNPIVWERECMHVVVYVNFCKFTQSEHLMNGLMQTGTKKIVEASPTDRIWGIGYSEKDALMNMNSWGANKLGRCLMEVREMISSLKTSMTRNVMTPVNRTTFVICYFCISTTMGSPISEDTKMDVSNIMITTCSTCMKMHGLAYGPIHDSVVRKIILCVRKNEKMHEKIKKIMIPIILVAVHPKKIVFMDWSACSLTKQEGYRDPSGRLSMDWRV